MFKICKLNDLKVDDLKIEMVPLEIHTYNNGIKDVKKFNVPEFIINGTDGDNNYKLYFRFDKPMEELYNIELNSYVSFDKFSDSLNGFEINGFNDYDVNILGKIYRIINKNIVINGLFVIDDILDDEDEDYVGKFEIEFNLDDYINNDEKSDM